jgi:hypothetical protein
MFFNPLYNIKYSFLFLFLFISALVSILLEEGVQLHIILLPCQIY